MLGAPVLESEHGKAVPGLGPGKPLAVICYLSLRGGARRDELVGLLWGDIDEKRARNAFRQTLHRLRNAVPGLIGQEPADRIQLELGLMTDVASFEQAIRDRQWHEAVELYRGDFLEGFDVGEPAFAHWADDVRNRLRAQWHGALLAVARTALDEGDVDMALRRARELLASDAAQFDALMIEAQALALGGRSTEAAALLELHAARIRRDFGAELPEPVVDMMRRLRATPSVPRAASANASSPASSTRYPAETARLLQSWRVVAAEQRGAAVLVEVPIDADGHALAADVAQRIATTGPALVLMGRESSTADVPYVCVAEALRGALRAPGLAGASDHLLAEAARLVPELRDRFPLPQAGPIEDEAARVRVFEGAAAVLEAIAYEQPVCMILEDLERAPASTIDLIGYLIRRLRAAQVMFILTTQPARSPVARLVRDGVVKDRMALGTATDDAWLDPIEPSAPAPVTSTRVALYTAAAAALVLALSVLWSNVRVATGVTGPVLELADTLLLADGNGRRGMAVVGDVSAPVTRTRAPRPLASEPPWLNPRQAPVGDLVAIERLSPGGTDVYIISDSDTLAIAATTDDDLIGGWSPDGQQLLVVRGREVEDGYRAGLWAYPVDGGAPMAIDTAQGRSVVEAAWSPTGARIAWVARVGDSLEREVFVADASGARVRPVSSDLAEDYHVAWSSDGERIAFTSDRTGDAEVYVRDLPSWDLWRITFDEAHDDGAEFSRDGGLMVFESTRGGMLGIYAVRSFGGEPSPLLADAGDLRISGWSAPEPPYIEDVRISAPTITPGDSVRVRAAVVMSDGEAAANVQVQWSAPDPGVVSLSPGSSDMVAIAQGTGAARLIAAVPGWRADTAIVLVGAGPATWITDDFLSLDRATWRRLGRPAPEVRDGAVVLHADREWPSGIMSERLIPLDRTVEVDVSVLGPFDARAPMSFTIALVHPGPVDPVAPQPAPLAMVQWDGSAARVTFGVGPESASEPLRTPGTQHVFTLRVRADGRVAFLVDGREANVSSLQLRDATQGHLWIAGVGTGDAVRIDGVRVRIGEAERR